MPGQGRCANSPPRALSPWRVATGAATQLHRLARSAEGPGHTPIYSVMTLSKWRDMGMVSDDPRPPTRVDGPIQTMFDFIEQAVVSSTLT